MSRPLVLLDVDGVLNALPRLGRPLPWEDWRTGVAYAEGRGFRISWSPSVVAAVWSWRELADVQWLTTWGHDANRSLRELFELPELPVAGTYDDPHLTDPDAGDPDPTPGRGADAHAAVAPAAPDRLTGRWWKFDVVQRLVRADPARPIVWLDDDLAGQADIREHMERSTTCLLVAPHLSSGLTADHLREVEEFLRRTQ